MSGKSFAAVMAVLAVVGVLGFGLLEKNDEAIAQGDPAPAIPLAELDGSGDASLRDYQGRWVLLNFWSSWCDPCRTEAPELQSFYERHRDRGFVVVAVDLEDVSSDARAFVAEFRLSYPQLRATDNDETIESFGLVGRPENVLIDPEGRIALIRRGPVDADYLREQVEPMIAAEEARG